MGYPISFILGLLLRYAVCLGNRVTVADVVLGDRSTAWPPVWKTEAGNSSRLGGVLERSYSDWVQDGPRSTGIDLPAVLAFLARRKWCIAVPVVLAAVGCWLVATSLPPVFSARAVLVLDTRDFEVVQIDTVVSRLPRDDATLRSQLDLITSRSMAERVVDRLDLTQTSWQVSQSGTPWLKGLRRPWHRSRRRYTSRFFGSSKLRCLHPATPVGSMPLSTC